MPTLEEELAEVEAGWTHRKFRKGDRVLHSAVWGTAEGTVWEDEESGVWTHVCVHWDGKPEPTGGGDDVMTPPSRLTLLHGKTD